MWTLHAGHVTERRTGVRALGVTDRIVPDPRATARESFVNFEGG